MMLLPLESPWLDGFSSELGQKFHLLNWPLMERLVLFWLEDYLLVILVAVVEAGKA